MSKFSMKSNAKFQMLSEEQIQQIHEAALKILEETGVRFDNERALHDLAEKGCNVDFETKMVRFPKELVIQAIMSAPEKFDTYNCAGEATMHLGQGNSYFLNGLGINVIGKNNERRMGHLGELSEALTVIQQLKNIDLVSVAVMAEEELEDPMDLYFLYQAMKKVGKTLIAEAWEEGSDERIITMLKAVKESKEAIKEKPFIMLAAAPAPPMKWEKRVIDVSYTSMEYGIPIFITSSPVMGVTAPVTVAGGVLTHTVENLSYVTFTQLIHPGTPIIYGGVCGMMDMRTTYSSLAGAEACLCTAGYGAMAKYYGIPSLSSQALTDSKLNDYQAGFETSMGVMISVMCGFDIIWGAGALDSYSSFSLRKLVMDNELFGYTKMIGKGIEFDEETLGIEEIQEVGCADEETHMQRDFTMENFRDSMFITEGIIDRSSYPVWEKEGKDIVARTEMVLENYTKEYTPGPELEAKIEEGYRKVMNKA